MTSGSSYGSGVDELPVVAFETSLTLQVTRISAHWTRLTGQTEAQALGVGWMAMLDPSSVSAPFSVLQATLERGEEVRCGVRFRDPSGRWRWLRVLARMEGQRVVGVGFEVTEAADEPAVLPMKLEELAAHRSRATALISAWPDLLFLVSTDGVFLGYQAGEQSKLYKAPQEFVGRRVEEVLPPDVARATREAMAKAAGTGKVHQYEYALTLAGTSYAFESRALALEGGDFLFVVRDVTQARQAQAELVAAREEALERSRLKTQFLANVSHEIRTPLNGILGVTQLLKQHQLPSEFSEYVDVLQSAGESLLAIVNDVLDLSKIEANRLDLEPRVFDLEPLIREAARTFLLVAQRKGLELTVKVDDDAKGPVRGDETRVRQIINNLVGNALKFTERGRVEVSVSRRAERVRIDVSDTGPGIAPEHQSRIFEAFEQADLAVQRRFGGTGLGLAITRSVARLMGGDVSVSSAVGQGATFSLEVPLPAAGIGSLVPHSSRITPPPRAMAVLLAEDDPLNAAMTAALLQKLGHQVHVVHNGRECVEQSADPRFELVLMDVHMPELDGLEATRLIRAREKGSTRHLPIVALTANAMKGDDLRCLSAGMDAYLPKPVTVNALKDLLTWFGSQEP